MDDRRLLRGYAHPDDEPSMAGATMISYARQGTTVVPGSAPYGWEGNLFAGLGDSA